MKITKRQLRRIIKEALEKVDWDNPDQSWDPNDQVNWEREQSDKEIEDAPGHIVDAETGEIYAGPGMRADFEIWLAENPEYVEAPPEIPDEWDKTDDFYVEPRMRR